MPQVIEKGADLIILESICNIDNYSNDVTGFFFMLDTSKIYAKRVVGNNFLSAVRITS